MSLLYKRRDLVFYMLLISHVNIANIEALAKFTNLQCESLDKSFAEFRHCYLKALKRDTIALNIHVELHKLPVNNVTINLALLKKANGYRPFLYNYTVNFCSLMSGSSKISFIKLFFNTVLNVSNINHTCPYDHDIIIKNLLLKDDHFLYIPFPRGVYMFDLNVGAYKQWRANVKIYVEITQNY